MTMTQWLLSVVLLAGCGIGLWAVTFLAQQRIVNARASELRELIHELAHTVEARADIQELQRASIETRLTAIEMRLTRLIDPPMTVVTKPESQAR